MWSGLQFRVRRSLFASFLVLLPAVAQASAITFEVGGNATTVSIQATVDNFRAALGNPNNANNPGPLGSGRREINWDGGGGVSTPAPAGTPFAGFQNTRGALFTTPGSGFLQAVAADLGDPSYAGLFAPFSPLRLFTPVGSNITDVTFFIPGSGGATAATVAGFGSVFSDVDLANTTQLDFFDLNNALLFSRSVLQGLTPEQSFSFLGVLFNAGERIARVRITTGNSALVGQETAGKDLVVMDDFLFSEPLSSVPEPATLTLLGVGLLAARSARRRRE